MHLRRELNIHKVFRHTRHRMLVLVMVNLHLTLASDVLDGSELVEQLGKCHIRLHLLHGLDTNLLC